MLILGINVESGPGIITALLVVQTIGIIGLVWIAQGLGTRLNEVLAELKKRKGS